MNPGYDSVVADKPKDPSSYLEVVPDWGWPKFKMRGTLDSTDSNENEGNEPNDAKVPNIPNDANDAAVVTSVETKTSASGNS